MSDALSRPTREQREAFARLSVEARFQWLTDLLTLCYALTPEHLRARWRSAGRPSHDPPESTKHES
jgi:hypothetical protein